MADGKTKFAISEKNDPVSTLAHALTDEAGPIALKMGISKMDVCVAMANAIGFILADARMPARGFTGMPKQTAMDRMDDLRKAMALAYDLREIDG